VENPLANKGNKVREKSKKMLKMLSKPTRTPKDEHHFFKRLILLSCKRKQ